MSDTAARLLEWYGEHARALPWRVPPGAPVPADPDFAYRVWLSEVMLQQTTVTTVTGYFAAFMARWPNVAALAAADDAAVMQAWAGLGYYARARNLLACARAVVADHGARFPADEAVLRGLPGIGDYTAAAIAAFAFGRRAIVIDGNVERVVTRLRAISTPLPAARPAIRASLDDILRDRAGDFAQAMMDLAGRLCTPRAPRCLACPLQPDCAGARADPETFPVKAAKRPRPTRHGTAWWITCGDAVLTIVRPPRGLLGGMRALPTSDWTADPAAVAPPVAGDWMPLGAVEHGFTHFELVLRVEALAVASKAGLAGDRWPAALAGDWWNVDNIEGAGLPTLFAKAARLAIAQTIHAEAA